MHTSPPTNSFSLPHRETGVRTCLRFHGNRGVHTQIGLREKLLVRSLVTDFTYEQRQKVIEKVLFLAVTAVRH